MNHLNRILPKLLPISLEHLGGSASLNYLASILAGRLSPLEAIDYILAEMDSKDLSDARSLIERVYLLFRSSPLLSALLFQVTETNERVIDYHPELFLYFRSTNRDLLTLARRYPEIFEAELSDRINEALLLAFTEPLIASELYKRRILTSIDLDILLISLSLTEDNERIIGELIKRRLISKHQAYIKTGYLPIGRC